MSLRNPGALLLCLALMASSARALAEPTSETRSRASALLAEGLKLLNADKPTAAIEKFEAAYALVPSPKIFFNLGRAHMAAGHDAEALEAFDRFLTEATDVPSEARTAAETSRAAARARVGFIELDVLAGADVAVDGKPRGVTPLPRAIATAPGVHRVRVARQGRVLHDKDVSVAAGATVKLLIDVTTVTTPAPVPPPRVVVAPPPPAAPAPTDAAPSAGAWRRPVAFVAGGLGVAALGFGIVRQLNAASKYDEFNSLRDPAAPDRFACSKKLPDSGGAACSSLLSDGDAAASQALIGWIAGGVLVTTGVGLFLWDSSAREAPRPAGMALGCVPDLASRGVACALLF